MLVAHQHAFDHVAVRQGKEVFFRTVQLGCLYFYRCQDGQPGMYGKAGAQLFGQICHLGIVCDLFFVQPFVYLFCTVGFLAEGG